MAFLLVVYALHRIQFIILSLVSVQYSAGQDCVIVVGRTVSGVVPPLLGLRVIDLPDGMDVKAVFADCLLDRSWFISFLCHLSRVVQGSLRVNQGGLCNDLTTGLDRSESGGTLVF